MKNFTYRSSEEKENIEAILRQRKRKLNRQQIIAGSILGLILVAIGFYVGYHTYYTEYDGYIHVEANRMRTPFDIYVDSVYVSPGDIVAPGDTLYSYYMIDLLVKQANPYEEAGIVARHREISLRYESTRQEINVLNVKIKGLKQQIEVESHNASLGLSSNSHKLDLERQLAESEAKLKALRHELTVLRRMKRETTPKFAPAKKNVEPTVQGQIYDNTRSSAMPNVISYRLAGDSSIITTVNAPERMIFFAKEEILTLQHLNLDANNLQVVAYVPVDKIHRINQSSDAKIIVSDKVSLDAHVSSLGLRTETIPENLRSYFTKNAISLVATFRFEPNQTVPFWAVTAGLPVRVRIRNWEMRKRQEQADDYLWFTTDKGLQRTRPDFINNETR
ncbi:MAG: SPOR domain-containing protein [Bacteroides sp.]|nr:SPOR domain-containing protein [Bacteroides sp.]MCM1085788.1 SPOR domain-containing protein [Bacteroides sp.]